MLRVLASRTAAVVGRRPRVAAPFRTPAIAQPLVPRANNGAWSAAPLTPCCNNFSAASLHGVVSVAPIAKAGHALVSLQTTSTGRPSAVGRRGLHTSSSSLTPRRWESPHGSGYGRPWSSFANRLLRFAAVAIGIVLIFVVGSSFIVFLIGLGITAAIVLGVAAAVRRLRGPAASSNVEQWLMRAVGGGAVGPLERGGQPLPFAMAALLGGVLRTAFRRMASSVENESRLGRVIHYNLQQRVRISPTIRTECGRGVMLGLPDTFKSVTSSGSSDAEPRTLVTFEGPLLHERLGERGRLHIEARVVLPLVEEEPEGGLGETADMEARRNARLSERAARRDSERADPDEPPAARLLRTTLQFLREAEEDLEDEVRAGGPVGRLRGVSIEVTRAVLRVGGGASHDITAEVGGMFFDDVTRRSPGAGGTSAPGSQGAAGSARVIDAEFFSKRR